MEQTVDSVGHKKDVIVIKDSDSPAIDLPRKRTRAAVAAEAAMINGHTANGNGSSSLVGSAKKRKVDEVSDAGSMKKAKGKALGVSLAVRSRADRETTASTQAVQAALQAKAPTASSSTSQANPPWDDSEGHYVITPNDVIGGRCTC